MFGKRKDAPEPPGEAPLLSQFRVAPRSPSEALRPIAAPPPPPRIPRERGGLLSVLSGALSLLAILSVASVFGIMFYERQTTEPGPLAADKVVAIPKNSGTGEIAALLAREGVIRQPFLFEVAASLNKLLHKDRQLKAGEFLFKAHASLDDTIDTLAQGKAILHAFTVPEGLTSEQIVTRLRENEILTGDVIDIPREGALLPDTYKFERGMSRQQLINAMQTAQRQTLTQIWSRRSGELPLKTPQDLVTLASIVEKETGRADERTRVAAVFINRLTKRMKLQSDPTIVYGLVGGKGTLGRGILRSEIERPTPYNTYAIEGLPPGPIANPGRAALEAVANPSRTKDLYFVADGTGGHAFAETYEQHQRNVARWRQVERARAAPPEAGVDRVEPPAGEARGEVAPGLAVQPSAFTQDPASGARRGRAFDASEGTTRDPLLNKSYDLNSPKTVPQLRAQ